MSLRRISHRRQSPPSAPCPSSWWQGDKDDEIHDDYDYVIHDDNHDDENNDDYNHDDDNDDYNDVIRVERGGQPVLGASVKADITGPAGKIRHLHLEVE